MATRNYYLPVLHLLGILAACSGQVPDEPSDELKSLSISPADAVLTASPSKPQTQTFTVLATYASGTRDVTRDVHLTLANPLLGSFEGATLTSTDLQAGRTSVVATLGTVTSQTSLTVRMTLRSLGEGVPANAQTLFDQASDAAGSGPSVVYPATGTLIPPNLGELEVMWVDGGHDLWELAVESELLDLRLYSAAPVVSLTDAAFRVMASSSLEGEVKVHVRGLSQAAPSSSTRSSDVQVLFSREAVQGAIYYWAATSAGGIIRYDFGAPGQKATSFFSNAEGGGCVACHALSRDGKRMAVTFVGGDGPAGILDVAKRSLTADKTYAANFQVFTPGGDQLIASSKGVLSVRDPVSGAQLAQLETGGAATMPDISPDGKQLVWTRPVAPGSDWSFSGGSIVTAPLTGMTLGGPTVLVAAASATENNYYPAYAPDGKTIVFNRSSGDSYSDDDAALFAVPAGGGAPVELARANQGPNLRNSWGRWSPFVQTYKGATLLWLTFSSTRDYGTRLVNSTKDAKDRNPQIWMTAIRVGELTAGTDPSFPAFRLPAQDLATNNHIAQWTEKAVALE